MPQIGCMAILGAAGVDGCPCSSCEGMNDPTGLEGIFLGVGVLLALLYGAILAWYRLAGRPRARNGFYFTLSLPVLLGLLCDFPYGGIVGAMVAVPLGCLYGMFAGAITIKGRDFDFEAARKTPAGNDAELVAEKKAAKPVPLRQRALDFILGIGILAVMVALFACARWALSWAFEWLGTAQWLLAPVLAFSTVLGLIVHIVRKRRRKRATRE